MSQWHTSACVLETSRASIVFLPQVGLFTSVMSHSHILIRFVFIVVLLAVSKMAAQSQLQPLVVKANKEVETEDADQTPFKEAGSEESEDSDEATDLKEEERKAEVKALNGERELIEARMSLRAEKFKEEIAALKEEKELLALENSLARERLNQELTDLKAENERLSVKMDALSKEISLAGLESKKVLTEELAALKLEEERLILSNSILSKKMEGELTGLRLEDTRLKLKRSVLDAGVAELQAKLSMKEKGDLVDNIVYRDEEAMYLQEPFLDGVLHVSDRRIALNGPIWSGLADYVSERINFFNNESVEYPIFLVIDSSPGGSVMSGYKILKSMHGSEAPVFVVVKSYAASMAASIATLAERSFSYPNAVILHHQISWGVSGNLTQQREFLEEAEEWWRRVARPVAEKMDLTLDEFIALMYDKNSDGDWREFGDRAQELKWIDQVVDRIWEMSVDKNPDRFGRSFIFAEGALEESLDEEGKPFMALPRLEPFDFYYLYNPDEYYRLR